MTITRDYRYRAAQAVTARSRLAMQALQARRQQQSLVTPGAGDQQEAAILGFDAALYQETERALAMAEAALDDLASDEAEREE
ncbi:MAG: hypothetical protein IVW36_09645 [Dehalococcoidia bacterium]|nr:hypothetical protein [Dehalococcoidia bacterium]